MLGKRIRLPGPAMIVALLALFVALSGTAVAAGIVPLAKRALVADNAKKLNGATLKQVIGGIVTAAPALVSVQTQPWSLNGGGGNDFSVACASGAKAIAGGYENPTGDAIALDTRPSSDQTAWKIFLQNISSSAGASGTLYAVCLAQQAHVIESNVIAPSATVGGAMTALCNDSAANPPSDGANMYIVRQ